MQNFNLTKVTKKGVKRDWLNVISAFRSLSPVGVLAPLVRGLVVVPVFVTGIPTVVPGFPLILFWLYISGNNVYIYDKNFMYIF